MPPAIKAVIFDGDGTLIDSVDFHARGVGRCFADLSMHSDALDLKEDIFKSTDPGRLRWNLKQ